MAIQNMLRSWKTWKTTNSKTVQTWNFRRTRLIRWLNKAWFSSFAHGLHAMFGDLLSIVIRVENSQRILPIVTDNMDPTDGWQVMNNRLKRVVAFELAVKNCCLAPMFKWPPAGGGTLKGHLATTGGGIWVFFCHATPQFCSTLISACM